MKKPKIETVQLEPETFPSEWIENDIHSPVVKALEKEKLYVARMVGSKSLYHKFHPKSFVVFNANIVTIMHGKVWHGDLDLTLTGETLKKVAKKLGYMLFVLYESEARWGKENNPPEILASKSCWDTTKGIPFITKKYEIRYLPDKSSAQPKQRRKTGS